jgi:hypothetical protein
VACIRYSTVPLVAILVKEKIEDMTIPITGVIALVMPSYEVEGAGLSLQIKCIVRGPDIKHQASRWADVTTLTPEPLFAEYVSFSE